MKNKGIRLTRTTRTSAFTYGLVIVAYIILRILIGFGGISSSLQGMLVPICAYVVMAISLNLTVGILGS